MNLIIDAGNTCIKLAAFKGDDPVEVCRVDYDELSKFGRFTTSYPFRRGIVSSVVDMPQSLEAAIAIAFRCGATCAGSDARALAHQVCHPTHSRCRPLGSRRWGIRQGRG